MITKLEKVGFAFLLSSCFIMPLLAMDQPQQPQEQNQQQGLTEAEAKGLRDDFSQWIRDPNRSKIEEFIKQHQKLSLLQKLKLNNIGDDGAQALSNEFHNLRQLQILNLNKNNIGDAGAQALAAKLPQLAQLQELDLGANNIGYVGVRTLADVLPQLAQLQVLNLNKNNIGNEGAQVLAAKLPQFAQLRLLSLIHTGIVGDAGLFEAVDVINAQRQESNQLLILGVDRLQQIQFGDDEAIVHSKEQIVNAYLSAETTKIISDLIPKDEEVEKLFLPACEEWASVIAGDTDAQEGLALLQNGNGDAIKNISKHGSSEYTGYISFPYLGPKDSSGDRKQAAFYANKKMPSIRKLVVVAYRLWKQIMQSRQVSVEWGQNWLAQKIQEKIQKKELTFNQFRTLLQNTGYNYATENDMGNLLLKDQDNGSPFIKNFIDSNYAFIAHEQPVMWLINLRGELKKDLAASLANKLDPSAVVKFELSCIRKGHRGILTEVPACAEGAYLHIMQLIGELIFIITGEANNELTNALEGVKLGACGGNQQHQAQQQQVQQIQNPQQQQMQQIINQPQQQDQQQQQN